jgi:quinol monooxygenase YgiN
MIVIAGSVRIRGDQRERAVAVALEMARATLREAGCRAYRFSADLADPTLFYVHEEWESGDALAAHFQTPHMATFRAALPELLAGPTAIMRFDVSASAPLG